MEARFWLKSDLGLSCFLSDPSWVFGLRSRFSPPPPTPEVLTKDFSSATRSRMEILTEENLVGAETDPTAVSRTVTRLVGRIRFLSKDFFLSEPGSGGKISRLEGWGWKNDPDGGFAEPSSDPAQWSLDLSSSPSLHQSRPRKLPLPLPKRLGYATSFWRSQHLAGGGI